MGDGVPVVVVRVEVAVEAEVAVELVVELVVELADEEVEEAASLAAFINLFWLTDIGVLEFEQALFMVRYTSPKSTASF